jgi:hypothetical protein
MRRLGILLVTAALFVIAPLVAANHASAADTGSMESDFVARINAVRASKGAGPLRVDGELTTIARRWAGKMASAGAISHNPNFANEVTANWVKLGENVGTGPDVASVHNAFVASSHHYANMIDPAFTRIGVGVVMGANGALYTSHQFMRLASDNASTTAAAPAPTTTAAPKPAAPRVARAAAAPRPAAPAPAPAPAPEAAPAAPPAPPAPAPVMPVRMALALEQLQGRGL